MTHQEMQRPPSRRELQPLADLGRRYGGAAREELQFVGRPELPHQPFDARDLEHDVAAGPHRDATPPPPAALDHPLARQLSQRPVGGQPGDTELPGELGFPGDRLAGSPFPLADTGTDRRLDTLVGGKPAGGAP